MPAPNIQLGAKFTFLETEMFAGFAKNAQGTVCVAKQLNTDNPSGITLAELVGRIKGTINSSHLTLGFRPPSY